MQARSLTCMHKVQEARKDTADWWFKWEKDRIKKTLFALLLILVNYLADHHNHTKGVRVIELSEKRTVFIIAKHGPQSVCCLWGNSLSHLLTHFTEHCFFIFSYFILIKDTVCCLLMICQYESINQMTGSDCTDWVELAVFIRKATESFLTFLYLDFVVFFASSTNGFTLPLYVICHQRKRQIHLVMEFCANLGWSKFFLLI